MSTSARILNKEYSPSGDRRRQTREALKWVVLAYFCENNWGKLLNLSESGMCLEFAEAPKPGQRINFTLQAMGRMPGLFGGEVVSETFQADGEIKWTREFERTAGVGFTELADESRQQIRKWLSFEASSTTVTRSDEAIRETAAPHPELAKPEELSTEVQREKAEATESASELETDASSVEHVGTLQPQPVAKILDAPTSQVHSELLAEEEGNRESPSGSKKSWSTRIWLRAASGCLALLAVLAGVRMILPVWTRRSGAAERISSPSVNSGEPGSAKYRSNARIPFLVEVQDAENRRWLLRFVDKSSKSTASQAAHDSAPPSPPVLRAKSTEPARQSPYARSKLPHEFTWIAPNVNRARANPLTGNAPFDAAPVVPAEAPPLEAAAGAILAKRPAPAPAAKPLAVGGEVQQARLIRSVPPVYPALARTNKVAGDVTLDALIDANGNVTEVKAISGPVLLRGAAMNAVQLWKYEAAQLDGRPIPMHLSITMKFHLP